MKSRAVRLVTKMPWRLQNTKLGLTASSPAVTAAATGPRSRYAISQASASVPAPVSNGSQRRATTLTPPTARNGTASSTFRLPM